VVVPLPPSKSQTQPKNTMYNTLSVINNPCNLSPDLLNKINNSTYSSCPIIPSKELNIKFDYRRGYPGGVLCVAGRGSSADPVSPCNTQENHLTVNKISFRCIRKGTPLPLRQFQLLPLLHPEGPKEGELPGLGIHSATVRLISAAVKIHRRG
jgi:hypothetical protein